MKKSPVDHHIKKEQNQEYELRKVALKLLLCVSLALVHMSMFDGRIVGAGGITE